MLPPLRLCHTSPVSPGALPLQVGKQPQPSTQHLLQADTGWCSMRLVVLALQTGKVVSTFAKGHLAGPQPASHYLEAKPHESWNRAPEDLRPLPQPLHGGIEGEGWKLTSKRDLVPPCPCPPADPGRLWGSALCSPSPSAGGERGRVLFAPLNPHPHGWLCEGSGAGAPGPSSLPCPPRHARGRCIWKPCCPHQVGASAEGLLTSLLSNHAYLQGRTLFPQYFLCS